MTKSEQLFERAVKRIPGGVNSPVRAYGAIGEAPRFIEKADGCYIYDVDGNRYIDYIDSWGPMILGHNFPAIKESVVKACENGLSFGCATAVSYTHLLYKEKCRGGNGSFKILSGDQRLYYTFDLQPSGALGKCGGGYRTSPVRLAL